LYIITIHFQRMARHDLKKLISLIFLFLLLSGCSSHLRLATVPPESPAPGLNVNLASIRIPAPPESPVLDPARTSKSQAQIQSEGFANASFEAEPWSPGEELYCLRVDGADSELRLGPNLKAETLPSEPKKNISAEKMRSPTLLKTARAYPKASRQESAIEAGARIGEDTLSLENISPTYPAEAYLSSSADVQDLPIQRQEFFAQVDMKAFLSPSPAEGAGEFPSSGNIPFAFSSAVTIFPSLVNEKVNSFIAFFQGKAGNFFSRSLGRSLAYEEMMKKIFREKNLPEELFYLALIESGYNPTALSRAKASGIWQFISQTAKRYGLRVDKWVDERRDPEKSTYAAAEYLKNLHGLFNSWDLAAASYNAGEGKVMRAMKNARSNDFWEISKYRDLKQETKKYVPMFLAAVTIAKEPQKYGFTDIDYHPPLVYEKVKVPHSTSFALIAKAAETDLADIRILNPALIREKTPPNPPSFDIKLPMGKKEVFEKNFSLLSQPSGKKSFHRVCSGETLTKVAKKYQVRLQDLCAANEISAQTAIKSGSILKIPH
jgi:soluble lytic murein transglycosylase-like protein